MKVVLSEIDRNMDIGGIINFMLDNNITTLINDISPTPHIEYDIDDLYIVWDKLREL